VAKITMAYKQGYLESSRNQRILYRYARCMFGNTYSTIPDEYRVALVAKVTSKLPSALKRKSNSFHIYQRILFAVERAFVYILKAGVAYMKCTKPRQGAIFPDKAFSGIPHSNS